MSRTTLLAACAATALAGCGAAKSSSTRPRPPARTVTTHATAAPATAWSRRADAVCARTSARLSAIPRSATLAQLARALNRTLPIVRGELGQLRVLRPPAALRSGVSILLARLADSVSALQRLTYAATAADQVAIQQSLQLATGATHAAAAAAKPLGLTVCGKRVVSAAG